MHVTKEVTEELFKAFNVKNCDQGAVDTNVRMQSSNGTSYIVVSFDENMSNTERIDYLNNIGKKIIRKLYVVSDGRKEEDVAKGAFDITSFPFSLTGGKFYRDDNDRVQFMMPISSGVVFNLKCHLAFSLVRSALSEITEEASLMSFDSSSYLHHLRFSNIKSQNEFVESFLSEIKEHKNYPLNPLEFDGNDVYVKDIFNDVDFIKSIIEDTAYSLGRDLEIPSEEDEKNDALKDGLTNLIYSKTGIAISGYIRFSYSGSSEDSIHIPAVLNFDGSSRALSKKEVESINDKFAYSVLNNVTDCIDQEQLAELLVENYEKGVYGIDFYDSKISNCIIDGIIENSVIGKTDNGYGLVVDSSLQRRKSRKYCDLSEDLNNILTPKFTDKHGYVDFPAIRKASKYIWQCLSESEFGRGGYDDEELAQFADKKIKEWRIFEEHLDTNRVISQKKTGGSKGSLSSGASNDSVSSGSSRSVSPVPLAQLVPRNYSDSSLSQGSNGFSASPFGTSPVEDENSKLSYQKAGPSFTSHSALTKEVNQIVKQVAGTAKVAHEDNKLLPEKPSSSFQPFHSTLTKEVNQIVKQAAKAPKVAPEDNNLLSEDHKPSTKVVSPKSKPHKPKWYQCTIA